MRRSIMPAFVSLAVVAVCTSPARAQVNPTPVTNPIPAAGAHTGGAGSLVSFETTFTVPNGVILDPNSGSVKPYSVDASGNDVPASFTCSTTVNTITAVGPGAGGTVYKMKGTVTYTSAPLLPDVRFRHKATGMKPGPGGLPVFEYFEWNRINSSRPDVGPMG